MKHICFIHSDACHGIKKDLGQTTKPKRGASRLLRSSTVFHSFRYRSPDGLFSNGRHFDYVGFTPSALRFFGTTVVREDLMKKLSLPCQ
jgi:hypothetical protein